MNSCSFGPNISFSLYQQFENILDKYIFYKNIRELVYYFHLGLNACFCSTVYKENFSNLLHQVKRYIR